MVGKVPARIMAITARAETGATGEMVPTDPVVRAATEAARPAEQATPEMEGTVEPGGTGTVVAEVTVDRPMMGTAETGEMAAPAPTETAEPEVMRGMAHPAGTVAMVARAATALAATVEMAVPLTETVTVVRPVTEDPPHPEGMAGTGETGEMPTEMATGPTEVPEAVPSMGTADQAGTPGTHGAVAKEVLAAVAAHPRPGMVATVVMVVLARMVETAAAEGQAALRAVTVGMAETVPKPVRMARALAAKEAKVVPATTVTTAQPVNARFSLSSQVRRGSTQPNSKPPRSPLPAAIPLPLPCSGTRTLPRVLTTSGF